MTPWEIKATEFGSCNCAYGCPCQFDALPTHGNCAGVLAMEIHEGHHGEVKLDGLRLAMIQAWPGPVHEGGGKCQRIVDVRADAAQRDALLRIMAGEDTEPFATVFFVFNSIMEEVFEPILTGIEFTADVDGRRGRIFIDGLIDVQGEPIRIRSPARSIGRGSICRTALSTRSPRSAARRPGPAAGSRSISRIATDSSPACT